MGLGGESRQGYRLAPALGHTWRGAGLRGLVLTQCFPHNRTVFGAQVGALDALAQRKLPCATGSEGNDNKVTKWDIEGTQPASDRQVEASPERLLLRGILGLPPLPGQETGSGGQGRQERVPCEGHQGRRCLL